MRLSFASTLLTIVLAHSCTRRSLAQLNDLKNEEKVKSIVKINANNASGEDKKQNYSHDSLLQRIRETTQQAHSSVPLVVSAQEDEQIKNESQEADKEERVNAASNATTGAMAHLGRQEKETTIGAHKLAMTTPKDQVSLSMQEQQHLYQQINNPYAGGEKMYIDNLSPASDQYRRQATDGGSVPGYLFNSIEKRAQNIVPRNYRARKGDISLHRDNYNGHAHGNGFKSSQLLTPVTDNDSNDVGYGARSAAAQVERSIGVSGIYGRPTGLGGGSGHDIGGPRGYWDLESDERQSKLENPLPWLINSGMRRATSSFNHLEASYNKNPQRKVLLKPLLDLVLNPSKK